jgi:organic radical activating enzyme
MAHIKFKDRAVSISRPNFVRFFGCEVGRKGEFTKEKWDTKDELLARILDAAARISKVKDSLRRKTRDLRTRAANCSEIGGEISENLF